MIGYGEAAYFLLSIDTYYFWQVQISSLRNVSNKSTSLSFQQGLRTTSSTLFCTCCVVARVDYYDTSLCSQWTTQQSFIYEWFKIFLFLFVGSTVKPIVNSIISSPPSLLCLLVKIIQSDHWDSSTLAPLERTSFKKSSSPKKPGALAQSLLLQSSPRLEFVHMYERILSSDLYSHSRSRAVQS